MDSAAGGTGYLVAGYALTWLVLAWYAWRLERRAREAGRALETEEPAGGGTGGGA